MKIIFTILIFFFSLNTYAHQPKLIKYSPSSNEPHDVINPEISKAYYGKLNGEPHYYKIESDTEFSFYVGITIPKIDDNIIVRENIIPMTARRLL